MNSAAPRRFTAVEDCVTNTLERIGDRIVLGLPLGIGKPNHLVNAFVRRAVRDSNLQLEILTGLSLHTPRWRSDLERRLVQPFAQRVFGRYPELEYIDMLASGTLPPNIQVSEFFLEPGRWLANGRVQQHYLSSNYTHVVRDALSRGLNVLAQLVAVPPPGEGAPGQLSLSCNPDLTADLLPAIASARTTGRPFTFIGQVHRELPFMYGDAVIPSNLFDCLIDAPDLDFPLFAPPNMPLSTADHMIALNVSALVQDGGTLQLGIGELGDAIVYALKLRHEHPELFRPLLATTGIRARSSALIEEEGGTQPFEQGLYGCSEMLVDGFLDLYRAGILKRRVYPSVRIQQLLDAGAMSENIDVTSLAALNDAGVHRLSYVDFQEFKEIGFFKDGVEYESGSLVSPEGQRIALNLDDPASRSAIAQSCLGDRLRNGVVLDGGFFLGPRAFYSALRAMPPEERRHFAMRGISFINELYGPESELKIAQRRNARFINTTMMVSGLGAAISDTLVDGKVVSGVGGQYNFVAMAHALPGARSILCLRSTRETRGGITSNIVWNAINATIPRHLRDIVVTEYGIANLRGRTDAEVVQALVNVMDARFQERFVADAKHAGKLPLTYRIPDPARTNTPARLEEELAPYRAQGLFDETPFGTEFTAEELVLGKALRYLERRTHTLFGKLYVGSQALKTADDPRLKPYLERMQLDRPRNVQERTQRALVAFSVAEMLGLERARRR